MKNLNELDKELIKADKMDTAVVREILTEINSADIPKPNYDKIRSNLFSKKPKFTRTKRIAIIAAVSIMMLMLMSYCAKQNADSFWPAIGGFWRRSRERH